MDQKRSICGVIAVLVVILMASAVGYGQISTATITGTVTDPQGAVIPGATLTLTNTGTSVELKTQSNEVGNYRFQNIQVGAYTLTASSDGFQTQKMERINMSVNQHATLDFALEVGSVAETVTVESTGVEVQSSSSELGQVVESKQVVDLPLNGRNFTQMLMLQPGVNMVGISGSQSLSYTRAIGETANPSVNGQNNRANVYSLDGVANFETFGNSYAVPPIIDAIAEFKVQSHNDSAEIGMGSGGTVNVVTKSGTNEVHGTAFYFGKNDALNARQFNRSSKDAFKQHQFGLTMGGPVYIPKVYDGRNKTFFFGAWQEFDYRTPARTYYNVPSQAMKNGDFSEITRQLFDPLTTRNNPDPTKNALRDPFPGNQIPGGRIDQRNVYYMDATKLPLPITTDRPQNNAMNADPRKLDQREYQLRVDHSFSSSDMIWGRWSALSQTDASTTNRDNLTNLNRQDSSNLSASWVHIFGPASTMQIQFGKSISDIPTERSFVDVPDDLISRVGWGSGLTGYKQGTIIPGASVSSYWGGEPIITPNRPADNWQLKGNYTHILGNHTIKTGSEFIWATMSRQQGSYGASFTQAVTGDLNSPANTGDSMASYLLNAVDSTSRRDIIESLRFGGNLGMYVADSWKVTPKLTLNLGLRYDFTWIPGYGTVEDGNIFTGNMDTDSGQYQVIKVPGTCAELGGAPCIPTADGSLPDNVFSVDDGLVLRGRKKMFQPRVGIAYRLSNKTTIRAGGGLIYDSWAGVYQSARGIGGNWPDQSTHRFSNLNNPGGQNPFVDPNLMFPNMGWQDANLGASNQPPATPWANEWWYMDPKWKQGYSMQWNFGVQHELTDATVVEVNYVGSGNRGLDLGARRNTAVVPGPGPIAARQRFPYMARTYMAKSIGRNNYNSLQFSLKRSFRNGLNFTVAYTWSKSIDIACSGFFGTEGCAVQDEYHLDNDRSVSAYDIPHNFVASWVYELPFGYGKPMATENKVVDYIIGGWQFNGIVNFRQGVPYHVTVQGDTANIGNGGTYMRANVAGDVVKSNPTPQAWLDRNAFAAPAPYTFGNLGRNTLRPDGVQRFDLSLFRQFPITERAKFEFRFEAFNAFNSNFFAIPNANFTDTTNFGIVTGLQVPPRQIQLGGKIIW